MCTAKASPDACALVQHHIASALAHSHPCALLIDLRGIPSTSDMDVFFRPRAEAIASAVRSLHLVGMRFDTGRDIRLQPFNVSWDHDHRSWNASCYQWYQVVSREAGGKSNLRTVPRDEVTREVLKLLHTFQFPLST